MTNRCLRKGHWNRIRWGWSRRIHCIYGTDWVLGWVRSIHNVELTAHGRLSLEGLMTSEEPCWTVFQSVSALFKRCTISSNIWVPSSFSNVKLPFVDTTVALDGGAWTSGGFRIHRCLLRSQRRRNRWQLLLSPLVGPLSGALTVAAFASWLLYTRNTCARGKETHTKTLDCSLQWLGCPLTSNSGASPERSNQIIKARSGQ